MACYKMATFFVLLVVVGGLFESVHTSGSDNSIGDMARNIMDNIRSQGITCANYQKYCAQQGAEARSLSKNQHMEINADVADIVANCEAMMNALLCGQGPLASM